MMFGRNEKGQSIIETVVAIFVMVMGVTAALGLANFSFGASTNISKQIVGMGLAREGLEAVKNMRDTNWLKDTLATDCYNFISTLNDSECYKNWRYISSGVGYDIRGSAVGTTYMLDFDRTQVASNSYGWRLTQESGDFGLDEVPNLYAADPATIGENTFYHPNGLSTGTSDYSRRITIVSQGNIAPGLDPYEKVDLGPRLKVTSDVWWKDKKCPAVNTWEKANTSCRIRLEMYLTNWKAY